MYIYICVLIYTRTHTYIYTYTYIYIYIYIFCIVFYIYMYIYIYIVHSRSFLSVGVRLSNFPFASLIFLNFLIPSRPFFIYRCPCVSYSLFLFVFVRGICGICGIFCSRPSVELCLIVCVNKRMRKKKQNEKKTTTNEWKRDL